jgi:hypothetical protein
MSFRRNQKYQAINYLLALYFFLNAGLVLFGGGNFELSGFIISITFLNIYLGVMILRIAPWAYIAAAILFFVTLVIQLNNINNINIYGVFILVLSFAGMVLSIFLKNNIYLTQQDE